MDGGMEHNTSVQHHEQEQVHCMMTDPCMGYKSDFFKIHCRVLSMDLDELVDLSDLEGDEEDFMRPEYETYPRTEELECM